MSKNCASIELVENGFALIRVTEQNKEQLLSESARSVRAREAEAPRIHTEAIRLDSDCEAFLELKRTVISAVPLRLVCSLDSGVFGNNAAEIRSYIAVSYCWRNPNKCDWEPVCENVSGPWNFLDPMARTLLQLRESVDEGIWFDEKCIDQKNEDEKPIAIGAMDIIYRSARCVVILLEDVQLTGEQISIMSKYWDDLSGGSISTDGIKGISESEIAILADAYRIIISARWFTRAWCTHEFRIIKYFTDLNGVQPTFLVFGSTGETALPLPVFVVSNMAFALSFYHDWHTFGSDRHTRSLQLKFNKVLSPSPIQLGPEERNRASYMTEYMETLEHGITEPIDRVQIALNLCDIPLACKFGEDYRKSRNREQNPNLTEEQADKKLLDLCCIFFSCIALAAGDFAMLASIGPPLHCVSLGIGQRSWIRYLTTGELSIPLSRTSPVSITSLEAEFLELDLLFLDGDLHYPSPAAIDLAQNLIVPEMLKRKIASTSYGPLQTLFQKHIQMIEQRGEHNPDLILTWLRQMLAISIDCGIDWMKAAGEHIKRDLVKKNPISGAMPPTASIEPYLQDVALTVLSSAGFPGTSDDTHFKEEHLKPILRFLDLITDLRFRYMLPSPTIGRIVFGSPHHATFGILKGSVLRNPVFAIPAALSGEQYVLSNRVWVLQGMDAEGLKRTDPGPTWRVVDKAFLLGHGALGEDVKGVSLRRGQCVYGAPFLWENPGYFGIGEGNNGRNGGLVGEESGFRLSYDDVEYA